MQLRLCWLTGRRAASCSLASSSGRFSLVLPCSGVWGRPPQGRSFSAAQRTRYEPADRRSSCPAPCRLRLPPAGGDASPPRRAAPRRPPPPVGIRCARGQGRWRPTAALALGAARLRRPPEAATQTWAASRYWGLRGSGGSPEAEVCPPAPPPSARNPQRLPRLWQAGAGRPVVAPALVWGGGEEGLWGRTGCRGAEERRGVPGQRRLFAGQRAERSGAPGYRGGGGGVASDLKSVGFLVNLK